jgi:hypothetical protein
MRDRTAIALMAAGVLGAAVFAEQASANVGLSVDCADPARPQATLALEGFVPGRAISGSYLAILDGDTVAIGSHRFTGPASSVTFALPRGTGHLVGAYAVGGETWSAAADVPCAPLPPAPQTPPAPVSPPEPAAPAPRPPRTAEPPAARPIDCAYLTRVGAGRRWLVRFGCVRVQPRPRLTCPRGARWVSKPRIARPVVRVNGRWWIAGCQPETTIARKPPAVTG